MFPQALRRKLPTEALFLAMQSWVCTNARQHLSLEREAKLGAIGAHRSRQTQRVFEREGLTTAEEKLSKVRGPV